jgi:glycosyltransferase involved in cell wall biosynthesis
VDTPVNKYNNLLTVAMPVYNAAAYLPEAIESILNQTYRDFVFLIINDCSTDDTEEVILSYKDERIKYVKNSQNIGVKDSLNKIIELTDSKYLARMDADDIAMPKRLEWQLEFMESHNDIGVCGGVFEVFGVENHIAKIPYEDAAIKARMVFLNQICHPSIMLRMDIFKKDGTRYGVPFDFNDEYGPKISELEDFALWHKIKSRTKFENIDKLILRYRMEGQNISYNKESLVLERKKTFFRFVLAELGIIPTETNLVYHISFKYFGDSKSVNEVSEFRKHLDSILLENKTKNIYGQQELATVVEDKWDQLFYHLPPLGMNYVRAYWNISGVRKRKHVVYAFKYFVNRRIGRGD